MSPFEAAITTAAAAVYLIGIPATWRGVRDDLDLAIQSKVKGKTVLNPTMLAVGRASVLITVSFAWPAVAVYYRVKSWAGRFDG